MVKTIFKLVVAAVLVNTAYRCGSVALKYYQFKDEIQQMVLFGQAESVSQLTNQILGEARKRDVPLDDDGVTVTRDGARTIAEVTYSESIELFPRYFYPMDFSFSAEAYGVAGALGARPRR
jgi:hypothetical protein